MLAHGQPGGKEWAPLVSMGMVVWMVLFTAFSLVRRDAAAALELLADPGELLAVFFMVFGLAYASTFVLLKLKRPPRWSGPLDH